MAPLSKQQITDYLPGCTLQNIRHGVNRVNLQLFGLLGHGKSSLINSSLCVMGDGRYENRALSGANQGGKTMAREEFPLTDRLVMIDNRGFLTLKPGEVLECSAQLRGIRRLGGVTWTGISTAEASRISTGEQRNGPVDLLVPVFVHSCDFTWNEEHEKEVENVLEKAYSCTGIQPIIVITHMHTGDPAPHIEKFRAFGSHRIITLENYTKRNHERNPETDGKIMEFLSICIEEAETRIKEMAGEDLYERSIKQKAKQFKEESQELKKAVDRLKERLKM